MEQLGLEGMPRRLYSCTPSRLNMWLTCPRRYRMTYLDRPAPPKGPPWAHNSLGASVHNALAGWWRLPLERRTPAEAGRLVDQGWLEDGYRDAEQSAAWRQRARSMVESYVEQLDPQAEPVGVERVVSMRTDTMAVSGRVDRIDLREAEVGSGDGEAGEHAVVVDYKTGRRAPASDEARTSLALALYALATRRVLRRRCERVELHHLPTGEVVSWDHTEQTLDRHVRRAADIAQECAQADAAYREGLPQERYDEVFPPQPSPVCSWCDLRQHCPEGSAAFPARQPWDALADRQ